MISMAAKYVFIIIYIYDQITVAVKSIAHSNGTCLPIRKKGHRWVPKSKLRGAMHLETCWLKSALKWCDGYYYRYDIFHFTYKLIKYGRKTLNLITITVRNTLLVCFDSLLLNIFLWFEMDLWRHKLCFFTISDGTIKTSSQHPILANWRYLCSTDSE